MNERLQFSWGHIIAFVALIAVSYISFMGITYLTAGNFLAALAGMAKPSSAASSILASSRQQNARRRAGKLSLLLYMAGALRFPVRRQRHRT